MPAMTARADITSDLVAHYTLDDVYTDSGAAGLTLTPSGTPTFTAGPSGFANGVQLDGTDSLASSTTSALPSGDSARTFAFRFRFVNDPSAGVCDAVSWGPNLSGQGSRVFFNGGRLYFSGWGGDVSPGPAATYTNDGTWRSVVVSLADGAHVNFYVDGAAVGSMQNWGTLNTPASATLSIGGVQNCPTGVIYDDVRVYSRALDASEALELANSTVAATSIPTLSEWGLLAMGVMLGGMMILVARKKGIHTPA